MFLEVKSSKGNRYLFDGLSNDIYSLNPDFQITSDSSRKELGLPNIERFVTPDSQTKSKIENSAKTLIIELTEQCNLRCTYCVFDEAYSKERSHSSTKIDTSLAKEKIYDFSSRAKEDAYLIFYGGEPLLEFQQIIELTNYAKSLFNKRIKFSFTTNGMALTEDKFNFLIQNDFLITVSLDGFKKNHDSKRITINGNPSWDRIMNNLDKLKAHNNLFYKDNLIINSVINNIDDLESINREINNNFLLKGKDIRFSFPIQDAILETKNYNNFNQENYAEIKEIFINGNFIENSFYKDRLLPLVKKIAFRDLGESAQNGKKKCVPFVNRTYLRSNGDMQFCERISSFKKVKNKDDLIKESELIQKEFYGNKKEACLKCIAYNFCELCPASFYYDGTFNVQNSKICDNFREEFLLSLKLYIDLSELNVKFSEIK